MTIKRIIIGAVCLFSALSSVLGAGIKDSDYRIGEKGLNQRRWDNVRSLTNDSGVIEVTTNSYTEFHTGLYYPENGAWQASDTSIELVDGIAMARHGQHKVSFQPNINTSGVIDLLVWDGTHLQTHVLGIGAFDNASKTGYLISGVKDSVGEFVPPNQILYRNCFENINADVRFTYTRAGLEQDVLFHEAPSVQFGEKGGRLEIYTEFQHSQPARVETTEFSDDSGAVTDDTIRFGSMLIGPGKGFSIGEELGRGKELSVAKSLVVQDGRSILIESLDWAEFTRETAALPKKSFTDRLAQGQKNKRQFPVAALKKIAKQKIEVASIKPSKDPQFCLDYFIVNDITDFTFQSDTTYYITSTNFISGIVNFEGGAVLKYTNGGSLVINSGSTVTFKSDLYRPVAFVSQDQDGVGEIISGSTGVPTGYYGNPSLQLNETNIVVKNVRFENAWTAISFNSSGTTVKNRSNVVAHAQIQNCGQGVYVSAGTVFIRNALLYKVETNCYMNGAGIQYSTGYCENVTMHLSSLMNGGTTRSLMFLTNSLLVGVTNTSAATYSFKNGTWLTGDDATAFKTIGAASHYLNDASPYRNAGSSSINTSLLADLKLRTTFGPVVYSPNTYTNIYFTLIPQAQRDTDAVDVGYHYDPLDYVASQMLLTHAGLIILPGTVIGSYGDYGITVGDGSSLSAEGECNKLIRFVQNNTVQEQSNTNWTGTRGPAVFTPWWTPTTAPTLSFRFTDWSVMAKDAYSLFPSNSIAGMTPVIIRDSQFHGGKWKSAGAPVAVTNALFERVSIVINPSTIRSVFQLTDFYGGSLTTSGATTNNLAIWNSLFDGTILSLSTDAYNDYNAYVTAATTLTPAAPHNVTVSAFTYDTSYLGRYYLPSGSSLINAGSVSDSSTIGFYHFTTQAAQTKETTSAIDIGFHYIASNASGLPIDSDAEGKPDYLEDANGNGAVDAGETNWASSATELTILITEPKRNLNIP